MKREEYLQRIEDAYGSERINSDTYYKLLGCESIFCEDEDAEGEREEENKINVKETLEKQLKILSECSEDIASHKGYRTTCICDLSEAMCKNAEILAKCKDQEVQINLHFQSGEILYKNMLKDILEVITEQTKEYHNVKINITGDT